MNPSSSQPRSIAGKLLRLVPASVAAAAVVSACGGGSSATTTSTPQSASGTLQLQVTDGPSEVVDHAWVTITQVAVNASNTAELTDGGWVLDTLPAPVTLDLSTLSSGALSSVIASLSLPVGTYKQIRLVLADSTDALTNPAVAAGLQYNDQVDYVDAQGSPQVAPLIMGGARQGIPLYGNFAVTASGVLSLVVEFDLNDIVPFRSSQTTAFTLEPHLHYYDLATSGAIVGSIDTSACASLASNPCSDVVVKAEKVSADGTVHESARWTKVGADGSFTLFPIAADAVQSYDLVVRGTNAQTLLETGVPVTPGTSPTAGATAVSATPLVLPAAPSYFVNFASGASPTGTSGKFYQTLTADGIPYEIVGNRFDPFSGVFMDDLALSGGTVMVGSYAAAASPSFSSVAPAQGSGTYAAQVRGWGVAPTAAGATAASTDGSTTLLSMPALTPSTDVAGFGTIGGTISELTAGKYDSGFLVVTHAGEIVNTLDIGSVLQAGGGSGGAYSIGSLPCGSSSNLIGHAGNGAGIYYAYLRVWNSSNPAAVTIVPVNGSADLDATNVGTLNVTIP